MRCINTSREGHAILQHRGSRLVLSRSRNVPVENWDSIRDFWFGTNPDDNATAQQRSKFWWSKNPQVDDEIRTRYQEQVEAIVERKFDSWASTPRGLLALILLSDQFPRNIFRNSLRAFEFDHLARAWCLSGLERGVDRKLRPIERVFFYLPLEHSESREHQAMSVQLFSKLYQDVPADYMDTFRGYLIFALRHRRVVERFGRFPHRNDILGRPSTPEEIEFLKEPGSSF
jgi:uncharacterized protein (DUF924 family)